MSQGSLPLLPKSPNLPVIRSPSLISEGWCTFAPCWSQDTKCLSQNLNLFNSWKSRRQTIHVTSCIKSVLPKYHGGNIHDPLLSNCSLAAWQLLPLPGQLAQVIGVILG